MSQSNDRLHSHAGRGGTHLIPALERWRQEDQGVQSQPWLLGQLRRGEGSVDSCLLTGWTKTASHRETLGQKTVAAPRGEGAAPQPPKFTVFGKCETEPVKSWDSTAENPGKSSNTGQETSPGNATLCLAGAGGQTGELSVTIACVWRHSHACSGSEF